MVSRKTVILLFFCSFLFFETAISGPLDSLLTSSNPSAEELPVQINAERIGNFDLSCFIHENILYVPAGELFSRIRVDYNLSKDNSSVTGFFIDEKNKYSINLREKSATIGDKKIQLSRKDFYVTETDIYINSEFYDKIFEIKIDFDYKQLKAFLSSKVKLPVILESERSFLRTNREDDFENIKKAEFVIPRIRKSLGLGVMDWALFYNHISPKYDYGSYNLSLGSEIFGGEFNAFVNGNSDKLFDDKNSDFMWRYVDDKKWFKQGIVGNITLASGLLTNTRGFRITNSPPVSRRTIGKYKIFDQTYPNWEVELYINNQLISYTKSNENGYFEFNVPLLYGSNYITLKYYGPSGEIRFDERVVQVPFNLLPKGILEYNISGGTLKLGDHNPFSESSVTWGLTDFLTVGSGVTYLDYSGINKVNPYANFSLRVIENVIVSSNYIHNVRNVVSLSMLLPSQIFATASYINYNKNDYFNQAEYTDEKNINAYIPLRFKKSSASFRFGARDIRSSTFSLLLFNSGAFFNYNRFQGSLISNLAWSKSTGSYEVAGSYSSASISYRPLNDLLLRQETNINHSPGKVMSAGIYVDKSIFKAGWLTLSGFRDFENNSYYGGITFRYDFSFGRYTTDYSARQRGWDMYHSINGSVGFDQFKRKFITDNQNMVSRGGLSLVPFLDANNNDILDDNEKILKSGFNTVLNAGKLVKSEDDKDSWYVDLDPYNKYFLEIIPVSFDNPLYRPKYKTFEITTDPNRFKLLNVPVFISGIISGNILLQTESVNKGVSMLKVIVESLDGKQKYERWTFSDGEFLFDNIPPGKYKVYPDIDDLKKRSLSSLSESQIIELKHNEDGDIIENINFNLIKK